jgi:PTH1 family peptidyl-tRNA hydrolase
MEKFLIAGLGNIGPDYVNTRHNAGFDAVDALIKRHQGIVHDGRLADVCEIKYKGKLLIVIKPTTFMNLSGRSIKYWLDKENIDIDHLLVVVDDLALPLTKFRLRASGSDAGHNGLRSIQECLETNIYPRLRFGIGDNFQRGKQVDFVLGKWESNELPLVKQKFEIAADIIEQFVGAGLEITMNAVNKIELDS